MNNLVYILVCVKKFLSFLVEFLVDRFQHSLKPVSGKAPASFSMEIVLLNHFLVSGDFCGLDFEKKSADYNKSMKNYPACNVCSKQVISWLQS